MFRSLANRSVFSLFVLSTIFSLSFITPTSAQDRKIISITPVVKIAIEGIVRDFDSQQPIPFATVQVEGTGQSP